MAIDRQGPPFPPEPPHPGSVAGDGGLEANQFVPPQPVSRRPDLPQVQMEHLAGQVERMDLDQQQVGPDALAEQPAQIELVGDGASGRLGEVERDHGPLEPLGQERFQDLGVNRPHAPGAAQQDEGVRMVVSASEPGAQQSRLEAVLRIVQELPGTPGEHRQQTQLPGHKGDQAPQHRSAGPCLPAHAEAPFVPFFPHCRLRRLRSMTREQRPCH